MTARLVAVAVAVTLSMGSPPAQAATMSCRSDGGYQRCATDTSGGVVLQREVGGSCEEGRSWGFDPGGIWVDRGCAAEFAVRGQSGGGVSAGTAIGVLGAIAALGTVAALTASGGNDDNRSGNSGKREDQAIAICTDYANRIVKDAGGRGARLERVKRTRRDGDKWQVEAYIEARWPNTHNPTKFAECTVNFAGSNRVTRFRHDGLDQPPRGSGGGGSWGGGAGGDGNWRERAILACQNEAKRRDFKVRDVFDIKEHRDRFDMVMVLERKRERTYADCRYEVDEREARLGNVGRSAGRG